jgi:glycerophosphoryl diester phosphodiesterase
VPKVSAQIPLLIAHRGESRDAPENTLAAFDLAWERGARAIECDVHLTRDGKLAVIHDANTRRIGGPNLLLRIQTLAQLQLLDAGSWKSRKWAGVRIPSIEEVLDSVPARGRIFIELKEGPECVPAVVRAIKRCRLKNSQIVVMSFDEGSVERAVVALPRIEHCLITTICVFFSRQRLIARTTAGTHSGPSLSSMKMRPRAGTLSNTSSIDGIRAPAHVRDIQDTASRS